MCIDHPAAAVHMDLPFPPDELPGADPASCEGCDGSASGRIFSLWGRAAGWSWGVPPGSGLVGFGPCQCVQGCTVLGTAAVRLGASFPVPFSGGIWFPSSSLPVKASLIYFQVTQKGFFGVGSVGKKRLNRRCRDVFPQSEWWGNTEHVLNWREVITLLIFLCDLIKM